MSSLGCSVAILYIMPVKGGERVDKLRYGYYSMKHAEAKRLAMFYRDLGNPEMAAVLADECSHFSSMANKYKGR